MWLYIPKPIQIDFRAPGSDSKRESARRAAKPRAPLAEAAPPHRQPRGERPFGTKPAEIGSPPLQEGATFLITIDRDCRTIYAATRGESACRPVAEIEQRLETRLDAGLTPDARSWGRGLKTIRPTPDGFLLCDVFGVYDLDLDFKIRRYLSTPRIIDLHTAFPAGDLILISNTGADEVLWIDWEGAVHREIQLHRWHPATALMAGDLARVRAERSGDMRLMPLDWARESCHVNWAEETPLGTMLACFIQGEILFFRDGAPFHSVRASAKLHSPRYDAARKSILYAASEENRIAEVDLEGRELWSMEGFEFAKFVERLPSGNVIVADTGNRRIVEVEPESRKIVWECSVPGTPYCAAPWPGAPSKWGAR